MRAVIAHRQRRQTSAGTIGVEIDPSAVRRVIRAVIIARFRSESLLLTSFDRHAEKIEMPATLRDERKPLAVWRKCVKVTWRFGNDQFRCSTVSRHGENLGAFRAAAR